jgi:hypothetical protein
MMNDSTPATYPTFVLALAAALSLSTAQAQRLPTPGLNDPQTINPPVEKSTADAASVYEPGKRVYVPAADRPNLQPSRIHFKNDFGGPEIEVVVDVVNQGRSHATPTDLVLAVTVSDPATNQPIGPTQQFGQPLPALNAGATRTIYAGTPSVPNRTQNWSLRLYAYVDPDLRVSESIETDNERQHLCQLFGADPDVSPGALPRCR